MSHELRTPLAAILGFSELLATRDLGEKPDEWGRMIHVAGKHLLTLVDEIMDLSRIEAGTVGISTEAVSLRPLVEEAFQLMRPVAAGHASPCSSRCSWRRRGRSTSSPTGGG